MHNAIGSFEICPQTHSPPTLFITSTTHLSGLQSSLQACFSSWNNDHCLCSTRLLVHSSFPHAHKTSRSAVWWVHYAPSFWYRLHNLYLSPRAYFIQESYRFSQKRLLCNSSPCPVYLYTLSMHSINWSTVGSPMQKGKGSGVDVDFLSKSLSVLQYVSNLGNLWFWSSTFVTLYVCGNKRVIEAQQNSRTHSKNELDSFLLLHEANDVVLI